MADGFASVVGVTAVLAMFVAATWAPFLLADRVRALFEGRPTGTLGLNYLLAVALFVPSHAGATLLGVAAVDGLEGPAVFTGLIVSAVGFPVVAYVGTVLLAPRIGDWQPAGWPVGSEAVSDGGPRGIDGRLVLAGGVVWYAIVVGVPTVVLLLVAVIAAMPM